jgi:hypothetical protein
MRTDKERSTNLILQIRLRQRTSRLGLSDAASAAGTVSLVHIMGKLGYVFLETVDDFISCTAAVPCGTLLILIK